MNVPRAMEDLREIANGSMLGETQMSDGAGKRMAADWTRVDKDAGGRMAMAALLTVAATLPLFLLLPNSVAEETQDDGKGATAPMDVPWPVARYKSFAKYPPSGTGVRVKIDDQRWVELNSMSTSGTDKRFWQANGEMIQAPIGFDPRDLVPLPIDGRLPKVDREAAVHVVAPKDAAFSMSITGGNAAYSKTSVVIDEDFVQFPVQVGIGGINANHIHVDVKVTNGSWESLPLQGSKDLRVLTSETSKKILVVGNQVRDYAWQAILQYDSDKPATVTPAAVGVATDSPLIPHDLREQVRGRKKQQGVLFSTLRNRPLPELLVLQRSRYDVVRFENLAVYPGPRSSVRVSVNGNRVAKVDPAGPDPAKIRATIDEQKSYEPIEIVGSVVDAKGSPVSNCWVGMFVMPKTADDERKSAESSFEQGERFVLEAKTGADGRFTMAAPRDHHAFDGSFWAIQPDGAAGFVRLNCTWGYLQERLKIQVADDVATVHVVDDKGRDVPNASVRLEAVRNRRAATIRLPAKVRQSLAASTDGQGRVSWRGWPATAIRGVAVSTRDHGTQYLSDRLASSWVKRGKALQLHLRPVASIRGRVGGFDPQRDAGLQLQIRTQDHDGRPPMFGREVVDVADDGAFSVSRIAAGRVAVISSLAADAEHKLRAAPIAILEPGENRSLPNDRLQMVRAVTVRQRIIKSDSGKGLPKMRLRVLWGNAVKSDGSWRSSKATMTDADGWWTAKVLPGLVNVRIRSLPDGYQGTAWFDGRNGYLGVEHDIPATDKIVTLPPERYVPAKKWSGQLLLPDGTKAADWSVYGHPISWDDVGVGGVQTDREGRFTWTYPTGYKPRFFAASHRSWLNEHDYEGNYAYPKVVSEDPFVLQIPNEKGIGE